MQSAVVVVVVVVVVINEKSREEETNNHNLCAIGETHLFIFFNFFTLNFRPKFYN